MFGAILTLLALSPLTQGGGSCSGSSLVCNGNEATCSTVKGCRWSDGDRARCSGPGEQCEIAMYQGAGACIAITNCNWGDEGSECRRPYSNECELLTQSACTASSSGCLWKAAVGRCSEPSSEICAAKNQEQCNAPESGCIYYQTGGCQMIDSASCEGLSPTSCGAKTGCRVNSTCQATGCGGLSQEACGTNSNCRYRPAEGHCTTRQNDENVCSNLSPTICEETSGCVYSGDEYDCRSSDPDARCYRGSYEDEDGNEIYGCDTGSSSESCQWVVQYAGSCHSSSSCWDISNSGSCNSAPGCIWDENYYSAYCETTDTADSSCATNPSGTGCVDDAPSFCSYRYHGCGRDYFYNCESSGNSCTQNSIDNGCVWVAPSGSCQKGSNARCYKNAEGTACDPGASASCTFTLSTAYCGRNSDLVCTVNSGGTGCVTTSNGCKWIANSGECYEDLTCYKNATGTGCDTESDSGCTWKVATSPSCVVSNYEYCIPNANNDGCAEGSSAFGCVWKPDDSSSSPVRIPSLLLLVLLLVSLSQAALQLF